MIRAKGAQLALGALFFLSGAAALGVETTWLRWLRTLFGATAPAASATLVAFFTGHAVGAGLAARWLPRVRRPLLAYAGLEVAALAFALIVPGALGLGERLLVSPLSTQGDAFLLALQRFALAIAVTLPAAACYGATLPVLGAAVLRSMGALGTTGAAFYGANTLGAALGAALASFVLPDLLGVSRGYAAAASLSLLAGLGALAVAALAGQAEPEPEKRAAPEEMPVGTQGAVLALAALSGLVAFAAQVLLVQAFAQVLNGSVYAFGAVLVIVLLALAAGALGTAAFGARRALEPRSALAFALGVAALALAAFPKLLYESTDGLRYVGAASGATSYLAAALVAVATAAGPALLALSVLLPLTFALSARLAAAPLDPPTLSSPGPALGRIAAVNTAGAIAGALAAPYVLLPVFGLWPAFAGLGALLALASLAVRPGDRRLAFGRDLLLAAGWVFVMTSASPFDLPPVRLEPGETLVWRSIGADGVVAVVERGGERLIRTDNYSVLGGTGEMAHQRRQGHLPLLLHPGARRVAYVGSATGISAGATLDHPIESLRLVEIVPGVAEAARRFFRRENEGVYEDSRTHVSLDDARSFFRTTDERYDLVVADLFVPWRAGTGALYTREHFEAVRAHLLPDGVFCQWLPLYQLTEEELRVVMATFLDVFPRSALFRGDFYGGYPIAALVGWTGDVAPPAAVGAGVSALAAAGEPDRWVTDPIGVWSLYVAPLAPFARELEETPRNEDDHPRIEFLSARSHAGGTRGKEDPVVGLAFTRLTARLAAAANRAGDELYPSLSEDARSAVLGGAALQAAGALYVARRPEDSRRAFDRAAALLPARLVRDAPADPTAAEVWAGDG